MNYDIYIPTTHNNFEQNIKNIDYIKQNIYHRNIYIITNKELINKDYRIENVYFMDEDLIYPNMTYASVNKLIKQNGADGRRTGWYLQQFLKMSISTIAKDDYYLVWDIDTYPLNFISFFDDNEKPIFDLKKEYHAPYFETLEKILELKKINDMSFIAEHMLFDKKIMLEIIERIENNDSLSGSYFWEKIINSIGVADLNKSGFSEFETYGTYVQAYYPGKYSFRKLRTLRDGSRVLGNNPKTEIMKWMATSFDTVSFERNAKKAKKTLLVQLTLFRRIISSKRYVASFKGMFEDMKNV